MAVEPIMDALATISELLAGLARALRERHLVTRASRGLDIRRVGSEIYVDAFVEADLENGHTVVFWLDVHGREQWEVTPEVRVQTDAGQDLLRTIDAASATIDNLPEVLTEMAAKLAAGLEEIDLEMI
jgi:hypothetical protein